MIKVANPEGRVLSGWVLAALVALAVLAGWTQVSCGLRTGDTAGDEARDAGGVDVIGQRRVNEPVNKPMNKPMTSAVKTAQLRNVYRVGSKVLSGAGPGDSAGFDELRAMGIKTILSVDGATPDVEAAAARGMRYVHIPITYAEVTRAQELEIARAIRDLPGPIYLHCHHGKHRGPAAAASAAVLLDEMTGEQGVAFMKMAGTAANYVGLYACVAAAVPATASEIDSAPGDFPQTRRAAGIVAAMVSVNDVYERLEQIRSAGWKVPKDHPDLVPAAEAGQLADHLRLSGEDAKTRLWGVRFEEMLRKAIGEATSLEAGLLAGKSTDGLEGLWKPVVASCQECHEAYRGR